MREILGLNGFRGAGKDTVAKVLIAEGWKRASFGDAIYQEAADSFGQSVEFFGNRETKEKPMPQLALKHSDNLEYVETVLRVLGCSKTLRRALTEVKLLSRPGVARRLKKVLAEPRSPRQILQIWGYEYRRLVYRDDYWREQVRLMLLAEPNTNFVITDVRFPDEADMLKGMGARLARVVRPALAVDDPAMLHSSETALLKYPIATVLVNEEGEKGLAKLTETVRNTFLIETALAA